MKKPILGIITASALALSLTACSASDPDTSPAGGASNEGSSQTVKFDLSSVSADETLAKQVPAKLQDSKTLNIATSADYEPAEFMDLDGQTPIGFEIDLIKAISKKLGLEPQLSHAPFESIIPAVGSKYDAAIASFEINEKRIEAVNMSSYMKSGSIYLISKDNPANFDSANLCGMRLGVQSGSAQQNDIEAASAKCVADSKPEITILPETDAQVLFTKLKGKQLDAAFVDNIAAALAKEKNPGDFDTFGDVVDAFPAGIVTGKEDTQLAEVITKATQQLIDDGTVAKIFEAWNVDTSSVIPTAELNPTGL
ncbi:ABC transporter substrate-binding protein [Boudabousia marimammalium]|uniref:Solute-binding protein family 3/N-terminal domain-containing protein n=1 Tax=Boudabousia marimammalium TaxID=156892 RepID=A0A1Q5PRL1_9ACTO|nr:ABC transporter substrate-binding protein [Boudabousia marimammalium]OKL50060.1 hypothetical protein BM477_04020 [Boudabousia marimammalium]